MKTQFKFTSHLRRLKKYTKSQKQVSHSTGVAVMGTSSPQCSRGRCGLYVKCIHGHTRVWPSQLRANAHTPLEPCLACLTYTRLTAEASITHQTSVLTVCLSLAGFRCSRSPITCRLPSQHRCLSEVSNHHRNGSEHPRLLHAAFVTHATG